MGVILVEAYWKATKTKFAQAFENNPEAAYSKYQDLKADSGATVSFKRTEFKTLKELGDKTVEDLKVYFAPSV